MGARAVGPEPVGPPEDRTAVLAELAARIAAAEGSGASTPSARTGGDSRRAAPSARVDPRMAGPADLPAQRRKAAIGARRREVSPAGGHPEDAPGDPAVVARQICLRQLTVAPRTRRQLVEALRRREIPDDVAEQVLDRLTDVRLIDDAAYAEAFVATRHRDRGLGRTALQAELQNKGVAPDLAAEAVTAIDPEAERARAAALVARRVDAAMAAGEEAARRRLVGLLARRGYGPGIAVPVVDEALRRYPGQD